MAMQDLVLQRGMQRDQRGAEQKQQGRRQRGMEEGQQTPADIDKKDQREGGPFDGGAPGPGDPLCISIDPRRCGHWHLTVWGELAIIAGWSGRR